MSLKIIVAGPSGSGKSAIALRLTELLRKEGFLTELEDEPGVPVMDWHEMILKLNRLVNQGTKIRVETAITAPPRRRIRDDE